MFLHDLTTPANLTDDIWALQAILTASDAAAGNLFGTSVAVSGDTVVVGASKNASSGSAYVFTRSGSTWTEQQKLRASDASGGDFFGLSVDIFEDTIVVGAGEDDDGGFGSGSAYVFTRSGTTWTEQQKLNASDAEGNDQFGDSVAIFEDTIVVGALLSEDAGTASGSAYVFTRSGTTWTEQQKLIASDTDEFQFFGGSVGIFRDTIVVGAQGTEDAGSNTGSAYVFTRSGSTWTEQQKLIASDAGEFKYFGASVGISGDTIVSGSYRDTPAGSFSGSALVFTRSGTTWTEQQKLIAPDAATPDEFGYSVGISNGFIFVGTGYDNVSGLNAIPTGYVFGQPGAAPADPMIASFTPLDEATDIPVGTDLSITFDTDVQAGTGNITLESAGNPTITIDVNSANVTFNGMSVTVDLPQDLHFDTLFTVNIDAGAIQSIEGTDFPGISDDTVWNFRTVMPPPPSTQIDLRRGKLSVTDSNGGDSDDNLSVQVVGSDLQFTDPNNGLVAGSGVTQVSPTTVSVPLSSVTELNFNLLGGNDRLFIDSLNVPGNLTISTGAGNDSVTLGAGLSMAGRRDNLYIRTGAGDDVVTVNSTVGKRLYAYLEDGNDMFTYGSAFNSTSGGRFVGYVHGGRGNDSYDALAVLDAVLASRTRRSAIETEAQI